MAGRRKRSDSIAASLDVARRSQQAVAAPSSVPLTGAEMVFFSDILAEFARSEWTAHQLQLAAFLAREMAAMEREQRDMAAEGSVLSTDKGTPVVNPRKALIQMHAACILSIRRSLSLHARAKGGEARDMGKRRAAAREVENSIADDGDGLLN